MGDVKEVEEVKESYGKRWKVKGIVKRRLSSHPIEMRNVDLEIAGLHRRQPCKRALKTGENYEKRGQDDTVHRV